MKTHTKLKEEHTHTIFSKDPKDVTKVRVPTERECSCRWRFADRQRCSSQALRSRESIVERTDGSSGLRKIMIKACGIDVQGTLPRACHIVLPYETYVRLISVIREGERCNVLICMCNVNTLMSVSVVDTKRCEFVTKYEWPRVLHPCVSTPLYLY